ncbi:winged helix-turn-helix domain-containing protein [Dokdonella sp.]|uniref:winged helix-turn-helix domain-containing protein n=1 Tax=Dokdonella sp. TaxID=2291710 RepID=UPI003528F84A
MTRTPATTRALTAQQARNLHLEAQGLLRKPSVKPSRAGLLSAIERMQLLQIDTIHVVARSPYLVLFSRLGNYPSAWLDEALERGDLFECWSHEACFVPSSAFDLHREHLDCGGRSGHWASRNAERAHGVQRAGMNAVLERIREQGPLKASDFEGTRRQKTGWWGWKDEKRWLEALFARGELMVARRERFQRVYDLTERVLQRMGVTPEPLDRDEAEVSRSLMQNAVRALGIAQARWIADYYRTRPRYKDSDLDGLVDAGELIRLEVRGWENPAYVHPEHAGLLQLALQGRLRATHTTVLSPFDPVVWDRERASAMFGFEYRIECYVPEPKRRYGYFVLPILHRGRLIGRLDAKAHRSDGLFEIKSIHFEAGVDTDASVLAAVARALRDCAEWHETPKVLVRRSDPRSIAAELRRALRAG